MPRILFSLRVRATAISGGVRVVYRHAGWLAEAGYDAAVINAHGHPTWFRSEVQVITAPTVEIGAEDIVIVPESFGPLIRSQFSLIRRKQVFCQNHHYVFEPLDGARSYAERGIESVYCASRTIADFLLRARLAEDAPVVPCAVDTALFRPAPKAMQIAFMPRKMPEQAAFIEAAFKARHPHLASVPWIRVAGRSEEETAAILGRSAVFLHLGWREGFGLPALEAMAAGAVLVGFSGGAFDLPTPENGRWIPADRAVACADALAATVEGIARDDAAVRAMIDAGHRTAAGYSLERARAALLERFRAQF